MPICLEKMRNREKGSITEAYTNLWNADESGLTTINEIIMKAMPKESKMDCLTPPIISFVLAVLLNEKRILKEIDILELQEESKEKTSYNEGVEETSEDNDDARLLFE
ncbi:unnamed protein product [Rhizophagus irregularis]|nr:unnamed protein product [Rhizophagus irregularis]